MKITGSELTNLSMPAHKKTDAQKTKNGYYIPCIDACYALVQYDESSGLRASRRNKKINYDLWNDILDTAEVQKAVNPFGIEYGKLPNNYRNCPLINPNLTLLFGEERKRYFNPIVTVLNSDAVSEKLDFLNQEIDAFLVDQVTNPTMSEEQIQSKLKELEKWKAYGYRDKRERMASQLLTYLTHTLDLKELESRAFEDLTIAGEEILIADIIAGEPVAFRGDPLSVITVRSGNSYKIEDSEVIIIDDYLSPGRVLDQYYDELTSTEITKIEEGSQRNKSLKSGFMKNQLNNGFNPLDNYINQVGIGEVILSVNKDAIFDLGSAYDDDGNIRVTRCLWKGMRKIGILEYFDTDGEKQQTIVPEQYKPNEELGENVNWKWISEWHEGTKIGEDIYIKMGPRPIQFRHMDNLSISHPGVVGSILNVGNQQARSVVDMAKPYQYMFNAIFHRLELAAAKDRGMMARLDVSLIPDGWTMDKWMYYAEILGWQVVDPFNEGQKGAAMGKLAGGMNQNSASIDLQQGRFIQQQIQLLDFLQRRVDEITGITPQRKGAIDNRETVGGIERSVIQSSLTTEKLFSLHDNTRVRFREILLETAKEAYRGKSFKKAFIMDDLSRSILEFESDTFIEAEYGVVVSNSSTDLEMMQQLKSLAQPFLQNGGSLSIVADLYRTKDPSSFQKKLAMYEEEMRATAQQAQEAMQQTEMAKVEMKKYEIDENNKTKIQVALIQAEAGMNAPSGTNDELETEKLNIQREKLNSDNEMNNKKLEETRRSNKEKEAISRIKKTTPNSN